MHKTQPKVDGGELKFFHIIPKYDTAEKKKNSMNFLVVDAL